MKLKPILFREADPGTPTGGNPTDPPTSTGSDPGKTPEKTFTQADVDKIVTERLEREKRKAAEQAQKAKEEAEAKALADQGEWKTLAEKYATEAQEARSELEKAKAKDKTIERLEAALKARIEADKKDLPKPILALLDKQDLADQMDWLAQNLESVRQTEQPKLGTPSRNSAGSKNQPAVVPVPERKYTL